MEPLQWLTPAEIRPPPPFGRWMLLPAAIALVVCLLGAGLGSTDVVLAGQILAGLVAIPVAWRFEERIFGRLGKRGPASKVIVLGLLPFLGCCPLVLVGLISAVVPKAIGTFVEPWGFTFVWWAVAASMGSVVVVVIDGTVSAWRARFPTRLTIAIFLLIGVALQVAMVASMFSSAVVAALANGTSGLKINPAFGWSEAQIKAWMLENPARFALVSFVAVFLAAMPAVLSACAKLADAAMERIRPMSKAFALVSDGKRNVRVEEAGSTEFVELAQTFNKLVETLDATERMEKAFGRYVSGHVLAKIRAQHGQAELKPSSREATVFFADIRGFTQFSEKLPPEQVVAFLNRYLARVVAQVDAHVGYLNKFIGDAVVVVFNGPLDQTDHAERAVRCALALQDEVAKLNAEGVLPEVGALRIGVGIATGPMVCGNVGGPTQMEYTVIGDTVNLSARLTSLAGPGEVWVSEATAKAAAAFKYTLLPEVKLKGKEKPVAPLRAEGAA